MRTEMKATAIPCRNQMLAAWGSSERRASDGGSRPRVHATATPNHVTASSPMAVRPAGNPHCNAASRMMRTHSSALAGAGPRNTTRPAPRRSKRRRECPAATTVEAAESTSRPKREQQREVDRAEHAFAQVRRDSDGLQNHTRRDAGEAQCPRYDRLLKGTADRTRARIGGPLLCLAHAAWL